MSFLPLTVTGTRQLCPAKLCKPQASALAHPDGILARSIPVAGRDKGPEGHLFSLRTRTLYPHALPSTLQYLPSSERTWKPWPLGVGGLKESCL